MGTTGIDASCPPWHPLAVSLALELVPLDGAVALADLKAGTFLETFAADNDPAQVEAHLARELIPESVERTLKDERSSTWWLLDDGLPVGFLKVNRAGAQTEPDLDDGLEVEQIYVRASHHGQGLGGLLMERAISTARSEGFASIWLGVWEKNLRAIAFYEHLGFVPFGDHTFLFGNEEQRDVLMRLDVGARSSEASSSSRCPTTRRTTTSSMRICSSFDAGMVACPVSIRRPPARRRQLGAGVRAHVLARMDTHRCAPQPRTCSLRPMSQGRVRPVRRRSGRGHCGPASS